MLDAKQGCWVVILDPKPSLLTTFNTSYGQCHFLYPTFGLAHSQDVFMKRMDQYWKNVKVALGLLMITPSMAVQKLNMMPASGSSKKVPKVWFSAQPQENTSQGTNCKILWMPV